MKSILLISFIACSYLAFSQNIKVHFGYNYMGFGYSGGCSDPHSICWIGPNWSNLWT